MNPYPFSELNHFTVPTAILSHLYCVLPTDRQCSLLMPAQYDTRTPESKDPDAGAAGATGALGGLARTQPGESGGAPARAHRGGVRSGCPPAECRSTRDEGLERRVDHEIEGCGDPAGLAQPHHGAVERLELQTAPRRQVVGHGPPHLRLKTPGQVH